MMITTTTDLAAICQRFATEPFVTLDTEFIRETTYYPELCLIQMASPKEAVCIDPTVTDLDLSPLFELLQNKNVVKVFHAARQDVEIFYHLSGQIPTPLFDTQVAAMVCGYGESVGYQQLVQDITGTILDKSMRVTDWSRRPLNDKQIAYALCDVTYLRDVYHFLSAELEKSGRGQWLTEELAIQNNPETYEVNNDTVWQKIKVPFKKPIQVHIFAKLCAWREAVAKQKNLPRRYILKDDALIELVAECPQTTDELQKLRGLPNGFAKGRLGEEVLVVIREAQSDSPDVYPKTWRMPKSLTAGQRVEIDLLRLLLHIVSDELRVAPRIIATQDDLTAIACGQKDMPCLQGWRRDVFGDKVMQFKKGLLCFAYNPKTKRPVLKTVDEKKEASMTQSHKQKHSSPKKRKD